jgi:ribosomal protein S18 acetylase RimI-like enzyme
MGKTAKRTGNHPSWNVQPATPDDVPAMAALLRGLGWFAFINDEATAKTETRVKKHLRLCMADDSHSVLVAGDAKGAIIGYVAVHWLPYLMLPGPEGYVSELFVSEAARGMGVGTKLLEAVEDAAVTRGSSRLMLVNRKTRESYKRGFYRKLGWEEREEFANFVLQMPRKTP